MNETREDVITIKKQTIILEVLKSDLIEVKETGDGIVFNLMGGLHLTLIEPSMPLEIKRAISNSIKSFNNVNITVDLMNYAKPVSVTPNK